MQLNADFEIRAAMHGAQIPWKPSPMVGVERRMLDRLGDEVARATTIVRYAPGSKIDLHSPNGLEILVLEGGFEEGGESFKSQSWLRLPKEGHSSAIAGPAGSRVWMKRGHLASVPVPPKG